MSELKWIEKKVVVGPFQCNCRIMVCPKTHQAVIVDPGDEAQKILKAIEQVEHSLGAKINVQYFLHTHGHLDHVSATRELKQGPAQKSAKIALHQGDEFIYQMLGKQGAMFGLKLDDPLPVEQYLGHGDRFEVGSLKFEVKHIPGHSPGSVAFRLSEDSGLNLPETVYTGDTLFYESVGRTDLWGAEGDVMFKSIQNQLLTLEDEIRVCPGHGPDSSIGHERHNNPFLK